MENNDKIKRSVLETACFLLGYKKNYISDIIVSYVKEGFEVFVDFSKSANIYDPVYSFRVHYNTPRSYSNLLFNILKNSTDEDDCEKEIESLDVLIVRNKNILSSYA